MAPAPQSSPADLARPRSRPAGPHPLAVVGDAAAQPAARPRGRAAATRVDQVMSPAPAPLWPHSPLAEAALRLEQVAASGAEALFVVAGSAQAPHPVGCFGKGELYAARQAGLAPQAPVGPLMVPFVLAVPCHAPLAQGIALMVYEGVHQLAVVGPDRQLVGVLRALDVLAWTAHAACDG